MECLNFDLKMKSPGHLENGFFQLVYKAKQTVSLSLRTDDNRPIIVQIANQRCKQKPA